MNNISPSTECDQNEDTYYDQYLVRCQECGQRRLHSAAKSENNQTLFLKILKRKWCFFGIILVLVIGGIVVLLVHITKPTAPTTTPLTTTKNPIVENPVHNLKSQELCNGPVVITGESHFYFFSNKRKLGFST